MWVGHGGLTSIWTRLFSSQVRVRAEAICAYHKQHVGGRANQPFCDLPGLPVRGNTISFSAEQAGVEIGEDDLFAGDVNFGVFVNETGGKLFYDRNDVDMEIKESERMGTEYYTLTYQPQNVDPNGRYRRIRVALCDKNLSAVTKAGYFATDRNAQLDRRQQRMMKLAEAVQ